MRKCSNCQTELDNKTTKCPNCGNAVCLKCGQILGDGVTKCPQCGQPTKMGGLQSTGCLMIIVGVIIVVLFIVIFTVC